MDENANQKVKLETFNSIVLDTILGESAGLHQLYRQDWVILRESSLTLLLRIKERKPGNNSTAIKLIRRVRSTIIELLQSEQCSILRKSVGDLEADDGTIADRYTEAFIEAMVTYLGPRVALEHLFIWDMPDEIVFRGARLGNYDYVALAAVWLGEEGVLSFLLDSGRVKGTVEFFLIALQVNASGGHPQMFRYLAGQGNSLLKVAGGEQGRMLWIAVSKGHLGIIRLLLEAGVDVNTTNGHMGTALHAAAYEADGCIAKLLLESGADPNFQDWRRRSPLQLVAMRPTPQVKTEKSLSFMNILLQHGADVNNSINREHSALYLASREGKLEAVDLLLNAGANPNPNLDVCFSTHPLSAAIDSGDKATVELLLNSGSDIDPPGWEHFGPKLLVRAINSGNESIFDLLVERKADPSYVPSLTESLLKAAVETAWPEMIKKLIGLGADIKSHERELVDRYLEDCDVECVYLLAQEGLPIDCNLLESAVEQGQDEFVKTFLDAEALKDDDSLLRDPMNLELLLEIAFSRGHESVATLLVDTGANLRRIRFQDLNFQNGICWCLNLLKVMEERHPMQRNINIEFIRYYSPEVILFYVLRAGREMGRIDQAWACANAMGAEAVELMQFFSDNFPRIQAQIDDFILQQAIESGDLALVELLMAWCFQNGGDISSSTALKKARKSGSQSMVKYILDWFQPGYTRENDNHFVDWKEQLEDQLFKAVKKNHFPIAQTLERYWLDWTSPRHSGENRFEMMYPPGLLIAALNSKSEIQLRFVLNSDIVKPDTFFKPVASETTATVTPGEGFNPNTIPIAVFQGNIVFMKNLVKGGYDFGARVAARPVQYGNFDWFPLNSKGCVPEKCTPLTLAAFTGQGEVVEYLLAIGTNPRLTHEDLRKPVPYCINRSLMKLIMDAPAQVDS